jgi:hypothetical protein
MSGELLKSGRPLPDFRNSCFKEKMEERVILYAYEGSSFRPFQTFGPSTLATSLTRGASNPEGSKARPLSYTKNLKSMFPFNDNNV